MVKNIIISLLAAALVASQDAAAYCRGAMALGVFAASLVLVCIIDDKYQQMLARRRRLRRLKRRITILIEEGVIHERAV